MRNASARTRLTLVALALVLQATGGRAAESDAAVEFAAIQAAHRDLTAFDVAIDLSLEPMQSGGPRAARVLRRADGRELRQFADLTVLETPTLRLAVHARERRIVIGERLGTEPVSAGDSLMPADALARWEATGGTVEPAADATDGRAWRLASATRGMPTTTLVVDPLSHLIRRVSYEYRDPAGEASRVTVRYDWREPPRGDAAEFEERHYVRRVRGRWQPAPAYAEYEIVVTGPRR